MYLDGTIRSYLDDLSAKKPTPGGGSAAALVGATGVGLISMVANFSEGEGIEEILKRAEDLRQRLTELIDQDVAVYQKVSAAYKLPKGKPAQKVKRTRAIQDSLKEALAVPLEVCRLCHEAIRLCGPLAEKGKVGLISDVGVGACLLEAAFQSAILNVEINLKGLKDESLIIETRKVLEPLIKEVPDYKETAWERTRARMGS